MGLTAAGITAKTAEILSKELLDEGVMVVVLTAMDVSELVADKIYKSDADDMYEIISAEFQNLAEDYLIDETEGELIVEALDNIINNAKEEMNALWGRRDALESRNKSGKNHDLDR